MRHLPKKTSFFYQLGLYQFYANSLEYGDSYYKDAFSMKAFIVYTVNSNPTTTPLEKTLLAQIEKDFDNYFRWVKDFKVPTTDNFMREGCVV
jgi:hypothetical protein